MTLRNKNGIHKEIKNTLNSRNAYYNSLHNLLSKDVNIKLYKTIIFPDTLCGCKTCVAQKKKSIHIVTPPPKGKGRVQTVNAI